MRSLKLTIAMTTALTLSGCASNRCPECGEPDVARAQAEAAASNSNLALYRECVRTLPLDYCSAQAKQWALEDQMQRIEQGNAMMLGNQNMMLFNQYYQQYYGPNRRY
jgi:hypothetical protein